MRSPVLCARAKHHSLIKNHAKHSEPLLPEAFSLEHCHGIRAQVSSRFLEPRVVVM
jgi:hypothetical protein